MSEHGAHERRIRWVLIHKDEPGAGAKARRKSHLRGPEKVEAVMREFARGTLRHGGSGRIVPKSRPDIAKAIAMSEAGLSRKKPKRIKRRPHGSGVLTIIEVQRGYRRVG